MVLCGVENYSLYITVVLCWTWETYSSARESCVKGVGRGRVGAVVGINVVKTNEVNEIRVADVAAEIPSTIVGAITSPFLGSRATT